jgi:DNA-binding transcriptional regulator YiaG
MKRSTKEKQTRSQDPPARTGKSQRADLPYEISQLRAGLRIDRKDLGRILAVSGTAVSDWERGKYEPSEGALILLGNLAHGAQAIYFWQLAGIDRQRQIAAVGADLASRLPINPAYPGESNIPPEFIAAFPELEWKNEMFIDAAADMIRLTPRQLEALIESGKIKARRIHPKGSYIVEVQSAMDYYVKFGTSDVKPSDLQPAAATPAEKKAISRWIKRQRGRRPGTR